MKYGFVFAFGIIFLIYGALNYYIGLRGWQVLNKLTPFANEKVYWVIFWGISLSFLFGRFIRNFLPYWVSNILTIIGSYWLGIMFYSFLFAVLVDIIRLLNRIFGFIPSDVLYNPEFLQIVGSVVIALIAVISIYGIVNARNPKVVHYDVNIPKTAGDLKELRIVALTDIHLGAIVNDKRIRKAVPIINGLKPDMVLLVGDTVDEDINIFAEKDMASIFSQIKSKYGNYAVLGNHEYIGGHTDEAISYIQKSGFKVLRDNQVKINDSFYLVGRDDRSSTRMGGRVRQELGQVLKGVDTSLPVILMDHQPVNLAEPEKMGVDLMLSGHTHEGQLFPNRFVTKKIYENDWGYLKKGNLNSIVSSGYGTWGPPLRVGSNSEIVDITVKFK